MKMKLLPEYGDLITLDDFADCVESNSFVDDDGHGYFATVDEMDTSMYVQPSKFKHYAMMPHKLVERMLLCSTREGDNVLDPFAGSGTTLKVAIKYNRKATGIDLGYKDIQEENLKDIQTNLF